MDVPGVSPIRCRHEIDLYGVKSGLGKFNPIMVENINKLPEPEEVEHPKVLKKNASKSAKKEKQATPQKQEKAGTPTPVKEKRTSSKLILTNQNKGKKNEYDRYTLPATFKTEYGQYMVKK